MDSGSSPGRPGNSDGNSVVNGFLATLQLDAAAFISDFVTNAPPSSAGMSTLSSSPPALVEGRLLTPPDHRLSGSALFTDWLSTDDTSNICLHIFQFVIVVDDP